MKTALLLPPSPPLPTCRSHCRCTRKGCGQLVLQAWRTPVHSQVRRHLRVVRQPLRGPEAARRNRTARSACSASTCAPPRRAGRAGAAVMSRRHPPTHLVGRGPGGAARGWKGVVWPTKAASAPHQRVSGDSRLTSGVLARRRCRGGPGAGAPLARAGGAAGGPRGQGAFGADLITLTQERRRGRSRTWRVIA